MDHAEFPLATVGMVKETYENYKRYCRDLGLFTPKNINEFKHQLQKLGCFINEQVKINGKNKHVRGYLFTEKQAGSLSDGDDEDNVGESGKAQDVLE